jgi:hypothetical protein
MRWTAIMILTSATAGFGAAQARTVTVCMEDVHQIRVAFAAQTASNIFAAIGVEVEWRSDRFCPSSPDAIRVSISGQPDETQRPNALAYALPFEGTDIVVFYDRVTRCARSTSLPANEVLAYVLVHEIAHILQGLNRHSTTGIMKARWKTAEYWEMRSRALRFTTEDVDLIYRGLDSRVSRMARAQYTRLLPAQ